MPAMLVRVFMSKDYDGFTFTSRLEDAQDDRPCHGLGE